MKKLYAIPFTALALTLGSACYAQVIVTFTPSTLVGHAGDTLTLSGILRNTSGAEVFLNGDMPTLNTIQDFTLDDTPFFLAAPTSLGAAGSAMTPDTFTGSLLTIMAGSTVPNGIYNGTLNYTGGATAFDNNIIGGNTFQVKIVPEPGTIAMFGAISTLGLGFAFRNRLRRRS